MSMFVGLHSVQGESRRVKAYLSNAMVRFRCVQWTVLSTRNSGVTCNRLVRSAAIVYWSPLLQEIRAADAFPLTLKTLQTLIRSENDSSVPFDRSYHWLLLALLDVSYSGALQILCWLIEKRWLRAFTTLMLESIGHITEVATAIIFNIILLKRLCSNYGILHYKQHFDPFSQTIVDTTRRLLSRWCSNCHASAARVWELGLLHSVHWTTYARCHDRQTKQANLDHSRLLAPTRRTLA